MYSWNVIRTLCAVLLLIPIIHLAYLMSSEVLASLDPAPEVWSDEIAAYVREDQTTRLPSDPIVVIGGRSVKLWRGLEDLLGPAPVLMRGVGDATVNDLTHYHAQLVGFYKPAAVVLLPGTSEFHLRDNKSADELVAAVRKLVELDLSYGVTRRFYVITPLKTPLYPRDNATIDEATSLLQRWADQDPRVSVLDANALLTRANGEPNPDFFRNDGVNLNEHGYLRLSIMLQSRLEQDGAELHTAGGQAH